MVHILEEICDRKRAHVVKLANEKPWEIIDAEAKAAPPPRGFANALKARVDAGGIGLIAEIKRASPSAGIIRPDFSARELAQAYASAGAACLSVLTDEPYFKGHNDHLKVARAACDLPVLRKDFMVDIWQVPEARAIGADCILLVMAIVDDKTASAIHSLATDYGMDVLIEVHSREELELALQFPSGIIGINNRNLDTLKTNLKVTEELMPLIPAGRLVVSESGISTPADIARMRTAGAHCFLVGESLLKQKDVAKATHALMSA